jgi:hypothetical protein
MRSVEFGMKAFQSRDQIDRQRELEAGFGKRNGCLGLKLRPLTRTGSHSR